MAFLLKSTRQLRQPLLRNTYLRAQACQQQRFLASDKDSKDKSKKSEEEESKGPFTSFVNLLKTLKTEFVDSSDYFKKSEPYVPPTDRRRAKVERAAKPVEANDDEKGIELHKQSRLQSQWDSFKDDNPVVNRIFDLRMKFDESDNILVRGARSITDAVSERLRSAFEEDESKAVLSEIQKMDPTFDRHKFLLHCEKKVIPAVLEGYIHADLDALKDWCTEPCYRAMENILEDRRNAGYTFESKILDLGDVEFLMAKQMDEGPVLIMSFICQQTKLVRDRTGAIIEGGEDNVQMSVYVFAMRRDPNVFDPLLAWQVLEIGEQFSQDIL